MRPKRIIVVDQQLSLCKKIKPVDPSPIFKSSNQTSELIENPNDHSICRKMARQVL
jgi:hypothetical protein